MAYADATALDALVQGSVPAATATLLLELASAAVDRAANRPTGGLLSEERTETLAATGTDVLWLDWPITAVGSVTVDGTVLTVEDDYMWSRSGWITKAEGTWDDEAEVVYTAGFAEDSPEIATAKRITLEVASRVAANPQALKSLTADGVAAAFGGGLSLDETQRADVRSLQSRRRRA